MTSWLHWSCICFFHCIINYVKKAGSTARALITAEFCRQVDKPNWLRSRLDHVQTTISTKYFQRLRTWKANPLLKDSWRFVCWDLTSQCSYTPQIFVTNRQHPWLVHRGHIIWTYIQWTSHLFSDGRFSTEADERSLCDEFLMLLWKAEKYIERDDRKITFLALFKIVYQPSQTIINHLWLRMVLKWIATWKNWANFVEFPLHIFWNR